MHDLSIFLFHRDLRVQDNTGLIAALKHSKKVIPLLILDPKQADPEKNSYFSPKAFSFLLDSLVDLDASLKQFGSKLYTVEGDTLQVLETICAALPVDAFYSNKDYTPFAKKRDRTIERVLIKQKVPVFFFNDALLTPPGTVLKNDNTPYTVFTAFFNKASQQSIPSATQNRRKNFFSGRIKGVTSFPIISWQKKYQDGPIRGGRTVAKRILRKAKPMLRQYDKKRDLPGIAATSLLSAHHKFGTISIRETYHWAGSLPPKAKKQFHTELFWRDFFSHISHHFPHVYGSAFRKKYNNVTWSMSKKKFTRWQEGMTGFPIVDAGMRELAQTGYMHNRVRMIVASFLVKDLHIHWQWGEKFFAQSLVDYDPAVNNGNWQWVASTGCDAQPYFRIFNPWTQQKKFDPDCVYIKKWVPELAHYEATAIHAIEKKPLLDSTYPTPMIVHAKERLQTLKRYKTALKKR